jgi:hypothetical protein
MLGRSAWGHAPKAKAAVSRVASFKRAWSSWRRTREKASCSRVSTSAGIELAAAFLLDPGESLLEIGRESRMNPFVRTETELRQA